MEEMEDEGREEEDESKMIFLNVAPKKRMEMSEIMTEVSVVHKLGQSTSEDDVDVTFSTYKTYLTLSKINCILFPLTILAFLLS